MPIGIWYWLLMFLWLIIGGWWGWTTPPPGRYPLWGWSIVLFLLFFLIGWHDFGSPLRGG